MSDTTTLPASTTTPNTGAPIAGDTGAPKPSDILGAAFQRLSGALSDRPSGISATVGRALIGAALNGEEVAEWLERVQRAGAQIGECAESMERGTRAGYPVGDRRVSLSIGECYAALTGADSKAAKDAESATWKRMQGR